MTEDVERVKGEKQSNCEYEGHRLQQRLAAQIVMLRAATAEAEALMLAAAAAADVRERSERKREEIRASRGAEGPISDP